MNCDSTAAAIHLTAEQIAAAPDQVQEWLRGQADDPLCYVDGFILERGGTLSTEDGLAICSGLEIKALLRCLAEDYLACQILFALGCELYDVVTGEHRAFALDFDDFRDRTDIRDMFELDACLGRINDALRRIRQDGHAAIHHYEHGNYHVHALTQQRIYRFWRHLARVPAARGHAGAAALI